MIEVDEEKLMSKLYTSGDYIKKNPKLHVEDTPWKLAKVFPFVDYILPRLGTKNISLLDVGGGAGLILRAVAEHIRMKGFNVDKYALDISSEMLDIQLKNNQDAQVFCEDIHDTSFANKTIDILLLLDVLEHVPMPGDALREIRRIAKYMIINVPLEDHIAMKTFDRISKGSIRQHLLDTYGHVNKYSYCTIMEELNCIGNVLKYEFTNSYSNRLKTKAYQNAVINSKIYKLGLYFAAGCSLLSPRVASMLFGDTILCLVQINED